jgi:thiopeptide-type bacteriocin biosynthesis protein
MMNEHFFDEPGDPENSWLSAYLFYAGSLDELLHKSVGPWLADMQAQGFIKGYFFIRYGEGGPHIRLRLRGRNSILEEQVRPLLEEYFTAFFQQLPSDSWKGAMGTDYVACVAYEPETERYGGPGGLRIAEQLFQASSRAVLASLVQISAPGYARTLGVGLQLHLAMVHALGLHKEQVVSFFSFVVQNWLPSAYMANNKRIPPEQHLARRNQILQSFEHAYSQQAILGAIVAQTWQALEDQCAFEEKWYNDWILDLAPIAKRLQELQLQRPYTYALRRVPGLTEETVLFYSVMDSYVHMTNNRLGITNRDEAYLAFLLKKGLEA